MKDRTMIIVAAGESSRFGSDKVTTEIDGKPLLTHTIDAISPHVDQVVLVVREDLRDRFAAPDMIVVPGGPTRTASEIIGLNAAPPSMLIGVHDGARPAITGELIESLFECAQRDGGAVPGLATDGATVDHEVVDARGYVYRVQTPQVFWGPELRAAYASAQRVAGFSTRDTMAVVSRFTRLKTTIIPGDPSNIKVTHSSDLARLEHIFLNRSNKST